IRVRPTAPAAPAMKTFMHLRRGSVQACDTLSDDAHLRALAFKIAYRMLGSVADAEDVVQEALLRLHDRSPLDNIEAFLTTVTTRLSIDVLRSARVRRETYVGEWLPEPLVEDEAPQLVEDSDEISLA